MFLLLSLNVCELPRSISQAQLARDNEDGKNTYKRQNRRSLPTLFAAVPVSSKMKYIYRSVDLYEREGGNFAVPLVYLL